MRARLIKWVSVAAGRWSRKPLHGGTLSVGAFRRQLDKEIAASEPSKMPVLLVLSLVRSDSIDAALGERWAHEVEIAVLQRITAVLHKRDRIAVASREELWILLCDLSSAAIANLAAVNIVNTLETPIVVKDKVATVRPWIGIALADEPGHDATALLKAASQARTRARTLNQPYCVATHNEHLETLNMDLVMALENALSQNALSLCYQPKVSLPSHRPTSVEALIRWPAQVEPFMTPTVLVNIAEQFGMMPQLTRHVLHSALREYASLLGPCGVPKVWINLSVRMLSDPSLLGLLQQALDIWGLKPQVLGLEITESMFITDMEQSVSMLDQLAKQGFALAIDDFGTGYSSLAYLRRMPIDELKIDKLFVQTMTSSKSDMQIVRSIIDLSHNFHLHVVAEGVEDTETLDLLTRMGCDQIQGYIFAKPMPAHALVQWWGLHGKGRADAVAMETSSATK